MQPLFPNGVAVIAVTAINYAEFWQVFVTSQGLGICGMRIVKPPVMRVVKINSEATQNCFSEDVKAIFEELARLWIVRTFAPWQFLFSVFNLSK